MKQSFLIRVLYVTFFIIDLKMEEESQRPQQYDEDGDKILNIGSRSKLQKQEDEETRKQHRLNMIRQSKNASDSIGFIAQPSEIAFRDFNLGKPHFLTITLTNRFGGFNSFNVLPLPEKIRNYFEVEYNPKGPMTAGISTKIKFKFLPQINEDINSQFTIVAQTGKISFPIICTSKKTIVRCDNNLVKFDKIIFGESKTAKLIIRNEGSLPSHYMFQNENGSPLVQNQESDSSMLTNMEFEKSGQIGGNTQKAIKFLFKPKQLGFQSLKLLLYIKNILYSPPIPITFEAQCIEVPVKIEKSLYDFQICLLGHIYRQRLRFYNSGETSMSFRMNQPSETKAFFQFNPMVGYIQKESSIDIWIKFQADKDLVMYLSKFLVEKNIYVIPFSMSVKQQILPVNFELKFKITSDKINIKPAQLNFGKIFEGLSSKIQVQFENLSDLPQQILLHPLKKQISIQNDQPLLKILPLETIKTYIIYKSKKLQENGKTFKQQDFIGCKIITGQISTCKIDIHYMCQIVRPDLSMSYNKIDLPALQTDEITRSSTILKNNGNKQILFQIFVPEFQVSGLKITPVVKSLPAKQEVQINIEYHSFFKKLNPNLMKKINDKKKKRTEIVQEKKAEQPVLDKKQAPKKDAKKETKLTKQQQEALELEQKRLQEQQRLKKQKQQQEKLELQKNFDSVSELTKMGGKFFEFDKLQHYEWLLPIYFKQKDYSDVSAEINYLEITTTSIEKVLIIDKPQIDFGEVAVGSRAVREINILNKSEKATLKKKNIPIFCSFNLLNSLKQVRQNQTFRAAIEFQPIQEQKFQQRLEFYTDKYTVSCLLKGKGVRPEVNIDPESGLINFGGVLADQYSQKSIKIKNVCNFDINFVLEKLGMGIVNSNSGSAFSYIPSHGIVPANSYLQVKIKFKPDRISQKYFQKLKIHVEQQKTIRYLYVCGSCYNRQAYVTNYRPIIMPSDEQVRKKVEFAFDWIKIKDENTVFGPTNKTIILQYQRVTDTANKQQKSTQRKITIGSCKLLDNKQQKPTNFEIIMPKEDKFICDNLKGVVAPGTETIITFTYKPEQIDPLIAGISSLAGIGQWRDSKVELKLSGGFVKAGGADAVSFDIILRAYFNQL